MQQRKPLKCPYLLCINGCVAEWLQHWQVEEPRTASLRIHGTTYLHQLTFRIVGQLHYHVILVCVKVEQLHKLWRYKQDWELFNAPTTSSSCTMTPPTTYTIIPTYQLAQTSWSLVLFWPGLKPGAGPGWAQICQAKPSPDDDFIVALAQLTFWKAEAKPSGQGFSVSYIFTLYEHFIFYFYLFFMTNHNHTITCHMFIISTTMSWMMVFTFLFSF